MGDILDDAKMACDSKHDTVLRVGFLNKNDPEKFDKFLDKFDLVVTEDGSLCPVIDLLESIHSKTDYLSKI